MQYRYGLNQNYEDFASGRVLYGGNHVPNFPVRLMNEIYGRCLEYSEKKEEICIYDCCCGGGYSLTVLGLLNQNTISRIIGSDIDLDMIAIAKRNLALLNQEGLEHRKSELLNLYEKFQKEQHKDALASAERLQQLLVHPIQVQLMQADVFNVNQFEDTPDIIITDVPYGDLVQWQGAAEGINKLLIALQKVCSPKTVIALSMDKAQKITCPQAKRLERQIIGKRKFEIYQFVQ